MNLTDAGAIVGLLDRRDPNHAVCVAASRRLPAGALVTTWSCFTEAMYLLGKTGGYPYQQSLWALRRAGRLKLLELTDTEADRMDALMAQYTNVPMDLADASLVAVAESRGFRSVFTIDSDFYIYRLTDGSVLNVIR